VPRQEHVARFRAKRIIYFHNVGGPRDKYLLKLTAYYIHLKFHGDQSLTIGIYHNSRDGALHDTSQFNWWWGSSAFKFLDDFCSIRKWTHRLSQMTVALPLPLPLEF
jgi:hypothetical protein